MDPLRGSKRLPIFQDDHTFLDRHGRGGLRDIHRRLDEDWGGFGSRMNRSSPLWDDDFDRICDDFYQLHPSSTSHRGVGGLQREDRGHRASPDTINGNGANIFEDPSSKSRSFQISFNVQEYEPKDISLRVEGENLYVEAKHETVKDGAKTIKEFSRCVKVPKEVEADKLTSNLSTDGILTIKAPIPPGYHSVGGAPPPPGYGGAVTGAEANVEAARATPPVETGPPPPPPTPPTYTAEDTAATATPNFTSTVFHQPTVVQQSQTQAPAAPSPSPPAPPQPAPTRAASPPASQEVDTPVFSTTEQGRRMDLLVYIGPPYTPEDLMVKVEDKTLIIEATHERKVEGKRTSKSCTSREFELSEDIDADTVQASIGSDGKLRITARVTASNKQ